MKNQKEGNTDKKKRGERRDEARLVSPSSCAVLFLGQRSPNFEAILIVFATVQLPSFQGNAVGAETLGHLVVRDVGYRPCGAGIPHRTLTVLISCYPFPGIAL